MQWANIIRERLEYFHHRETKVCEALETLVAELKAIGGVNASYVNNFIIDEKVFKIRIGGKSIEIHNSEIEAKENEVKAKEDFISEDSQLILCEALRLVIKDKHVFFD